MDPVSFAFSSSLCLTAKEEANVGCLMNNNFFVAILMDLKVFPIAITSHVKTVIHSKLSYH